MKEEKKTDRSGGEESRKMRYIDRRSPEFPEKLRHIDAPPDGLYVLGSLPDPRKKSVAVIGARACSAYGRAEAVRFAAELAACGVQIISGMAYGVDSWAHHGALEAGGATFAVLGTGADVCYPPSSRLIYQRIPAEGGGILSEVPPGTGAQAGHFPVRNRIISALADIVLVIEARRKSGSLITADLALEQGRSVYALPGRCRDAASEGCNYLIFQGAGIALSPQILLEELGIRKKDGPKIRRRKAGKVSAVGRPGDPGAEGETAGCGEDPAAERETAGFGGDPGAEGEASASGKDPAEEKETAESGKDPAARRTELEEAVLSILSGGEKSLDDLLRETGAEVPSLAAALLSLKLSGDVSEYTRGFFSLV